MFDLRFNQAPNERLFAALCQDYARFGGIAEDENLCRLLADSRFEAPVLSRLLATHEVFHFQWQGAKWIPMVQFNLDDMTLNAAVWKLRRELGRHFDGWETASWLARRSDSLGNRCPLDLLARDLSAALQAARAYRFVALG